MNGRKTGGRKAGTPNKATAEIRELAMLHGPAAIRRLVLLILAPLPLRRAASYSTGDMANRLGRSTAMGMTAL